MRHLLVAITAGAVILTAAFPFGLPVAEAQQLTSIKLIPQSSMPTNCTVAASGTVYFDTAGQLRTCDGSAWGTIANAAAQLIFRNVANSAGTTQFSAASNADSLRFAGAGATVASFDAGTKTVTFTSTDTNSGGTITGVTAGAGLSGGGSSGNVTLTNTDLGSSQNIFKNIANSAGTTQFSAASNADSLRFAGSGAASIAFTPATKTVTITAVDTNSGGTVTSVGSGTGLTGGPITGSGSLSVVYGSSAGMAAQGNTTFTVAAGTGMSGGGSIAVGAGGTVTLTNTGIISASAGTGISVAGTNPLTITNAGTLAVANSGGTTQYSVSTANGSVRFAGAGAASVSFPGSNTVTITATDTNSGGTVTNSGTSANYVPLLNSATNITNSVMYQSGSNISVGGTSPATRFEAVGSGAASVENIAGVFWNGVPTSALNKGAAILLGLNSGSYYAKIANVFESQNPDYLRPALAFYTMDSSNLPGSEVERMRIKANGNVGIGNSNAGYKLDVTGQVNASGGLCISGSCWTSWPSAVTGSGLASGYLPKMTGATSMVNSALYENGSAQVGVGTTGPGAKLHVYSTDGPTPKLTVQDASGTGYPEMFRLVSQDNADPAFRFMRSSSAAGDFRFMVRGTASANQNWLAIHSYDRTDQQLVVHSNGSVGINYTVPSNSYGYKLTVAGGLLIRDGNRIGLGNADSNNGNLAYIDESWGINLRGDATHPVRIPNSPLFVGTPSTLSPGGTAYTNSIGSIIQEDNSQYFYTEHTGYAWGATHGVLYGAYKNRGTMVPGGLDATGNTQYYRDNTYGFGAAASIYTANGGVWNFYISPASTGANTNVVWGQPVMQMVRGGAVNFLQGGIYTAGSVNAAGGLCMNGDCKTAWSQVTGSLSGSGTQNYIPKWAGSTLLGNSSIYDNGNVGINDAGPSQRLSVGGNMLLSGAYKYYFNNTTNQYAGAGRNNDPSFVNNTASWMRIGSTGGISLWGNTGADSNDSPHVRIDTAGNLGVGNANPSYKLDVSGNTRVTGTISSAASTGYAISNEGGCISLGGNACSTETVQILGTLGVTGRGTFTASMPAANSGNAIVYGKNTASLGTTAGNYTGNLIGWESGSGSVLGMHSYLIRTANSANWWDTKMRLAASVDPAGYAQDHQYNNLTWIDFNANNTLNFGVGTNVAAMTVYSNRVSIGPYTYDTGAKLNIGDTNVNYSGSTGWPASWNSNILLSGSDSTSISFHDSGHSVATFRYTGNNFYLGESVGWGVSNLTIGGNLTVNGSTINATGATLNVNKVNANTIDPPYTIGGKRYATYGLAMTGVKEETTGKLALSREGSVWKGVIDFSRAEKGGDLWLFAKTTDLPRHLDEMTVLLTPAFDGRVWYAADEESMTLTVYGAPTDGGAAKSYEVSYRLTAPRFDAEKWPNTRPADDVEGMNLDKLSQ